MSAPEHTSGTILAGKYRIERKLGQGAMGEVFLAQNIDLGRRVAIKRLLPQGARDPELLARFRQEARAAAGIGHPGIVDVLDLGRDDDGAEFIVMEHLEGETLGQRLERDTRLPAGEAVQIAIRLLEALAAAHASGIVHRDLKPDNVFLVDRPLPGVKILDFGISKLLVQQDEVVRTATGAVLGTPLYMSPEQASGTRELSPKADLYALGVILYQMLSGRPPLNSSRWVQLLVMIANEQPRPLAEQRPDLPAPLCDLVMQLLRKDPARRPPDAEAVRARLSGLAAGHGDWEARAPRAVAARQEVAWQPTLPGGAEQGAAQGTAAEAHAATSAAPPPLAAAEEALQFTATQRPPAAAAAATPTPPVAAASTLLANHGQQAPPADGDRGASPAAQHDPTWGGHGPGDARARGVFRAGWVVAGLLAAAGLALLLWQGAGSSHPGAVPAAVADAGSLDFTPPHDSVPGDTVPDRGSPVDVATPLHRSRARPRRRPRAGVRPRRSSLRQRRDAGAPSPRAPSEESPLGLPPADEDIP